MLRMARTDSSSMANLIKRTPGLRTVLGPLQKLTHLDPKERHAMENAALARQHERERRDLGRHKRTQACVETRERQALENASSSRGALAIKTRQGFYEAARDQGLWRNRQFKANEMTVEFNDTAEKADGDDDQARSWKHRAE